MNKKPAAYAAADVLDKAGIPTAADLLRRQHARIEELERALGQASFCIRELLRGNKDGEYTLSIIDRALLTKKD